MRLWIVSVGEPLPVDGENVRLRRMGNLAMYASTHGVEVEWFSVSFEHYKKYQRCEKDTDYEINNHFKLHLVKVNGYKRNVSLSRIVHHISSGNKIKKRMDLLEKPDVIFVSMEPLEVSKVAVSYAKVNNVPCIVDVRDLWPEIYYDVIPQKLHFLLDIYVKHCKKKLCYTMSNCDSIVGLSQGFLNYGLKYADRDQRSTDAIYPISYPNYNYSEYAEKFDENWSKFGLKQTDFIVVFLGNFGDQFIFDAIIETSNRFSDTKEIKFVLCGNGKNEEKIRNATGDNVIIPGWIEKEQIASLLSYAKLGIAPYIDSMNYRLNTPNKFGEYLSASLPIAVAVHGEMERLLEKNECGYAYDNAEDLVTIINTYFNNQQIQQQHSRNARNLYDDMFNADNANEKLLNHIKMIMEGKNE